MTANDRFDSQLEGWLRADASTPTPATLHAGAIDLARRSRQRPGWLVAVRRGAFGDGSLPVAVPRIRAAYLVAMLSLIVILVLAAIAAGGPHIDPIKLGRNGAIAYGLGDISTRPYNHGHFIQPDGSGDKSFAQATCPTFSRDGTALSYRSGWAETAQLAIARADGSAPTIMPGVGESASALSPDGTQLAWLKTLSLITSPGGGSATVGAKNELWVTPVAGGPAERIVEASPAPLEWFSSPVWSPDGSRIAYAVNLTVFSGSGAGFYRSAIDVVDADGSRPRRLTSRPGTDQIGLSWSPDGRFLAYAGAPDGSPLSSLGQGEGPWDTFSPLDIFVIGADGSGDRNLTNSAADDSDPIWSPDGAYLASLSFSTFDPAADGLQTIPMRGSTPAGPPKIGPASDYVVWSPDATKLLWLTEQVSDPSTTDPQTVLTSMGTIDPQFLQPATTLLRVDHGIDCPPSWQRLEP